MKTNFYQYNLGELHTLFENQGLNPVGVHKLFNWHYKKKQMIPLTTGLAQKTYQYIGQNFDFTLPKIIQVQESSDRTVKFELALNHHGHTRYHTRSIESVLIPFQGKYTLCVSSQVGCAMKCSFCYTGTQGLVRNLEAHEIIGQFLVAWQWLAQNRPDDFKILNIVFMGQGEPLHNFDAVKKACEIFLDQHGLSIGLQKITISTSGYLPGLARWPHEMPKVNIALSLHAMTDVKRNQLVTINKVYPLNDVLNLLDTIPLSRKQFLTYEYLLAHDFNDTIEDAHALGLRFKNNHKTIINLIPFNPFPGSQFKRSSDAHIERFKKIIESYSLPVFIRTTKGDQILAACGQLNTKIKCSS